MKKVEKLIEKAVNWWTEVIKNPKFDNGDDSTVGVFVQLMAHSLVKVISEEQIEVFKDELKTFKKSITRMGYCIYKC